MSYLPECPPLLSTDRLSDELGYTVVKKPGYPMVLIREMDKRSFRCHHSSNVPRILVSQDLSDYVCTSELVSEEPEEDDDQNSEWELIEKAETLGDQGSLLPYVARTYRISR